MSIDIRKFKGKHRLPVGFSSSYQESIYSKDEEELYIEGECITATIVKDENGKFVMTYETDDIVDAVIVNNFKEAIKILKKEEELCHTQE